MLIYKHISKISFLIILYNSSVKDIEYSPNFTYPFD